MWNFGFKHGERLTTRHRPCGRGQGGSNEKILVGPSLSNDDVTRAMTSLLPPFIQNIGGATAPVAPPVATPL